MVGRVWPRHGHRGRPLNSVVIPLQRTVIASDELYAAFSQAPRPVSITAGNLDREREVITELLAPYAVYPRTARDVPAVLFDRYEIAGMLSLLTEDAYRYFMPRCIEQAQLQAHSGIVESLLFCLSQRPEYDDRALSFEPPERAIVMRFIEHRAALPDAWVEAEQLAVAREVWSASV
jgi:hypothetical protein